MSVKMYKNLIEQMIEEGIKVEKLKITDIKESIKLYKMFNK